MQLFMRICILTHTFPRHKKDFTAPFMDGVASGLASAENQVFVLTPYVAGINTIKRGQNYKIITYKYIWPNSLHRLGYSQTLTNDMQLKLIMWILSPFMYLFGLVALLKLIKKEKIDIINAHWILPNGFIAAIATKLTGVPSVSTLPGSDVYMAQKNVIFSWMARFATRTNSWVTSNSPQLLSDLGNINESNTKKREKLMRKFSSIIYGTYPDKFKPLKTNTKKIRSELNIPKSDLVVLGVGRLVPKKGFRYLVEAAKFILKRKHNVTFLVVGEGDQRSELEKLAKKLGVYEKFRFPGWADYGKLVHYYNIADVFILPSVRDEKGNLDDQSVSVVEAMACGKPIVATDFPGYKIVILDKQNGFLIPQKNSKEIGVAVSKLLLSKRLRDTMGKKSRELVVKNFSWLAIGKQYTMLFNKILAESYSKSLPSIKDTKTRTKKAKQIVDVLKSHLGSLSGLICLDVGCSTGVISNYLAKYFKEVKAVDIDEDAISYAGKKYDHKNIKFFKMPGEKLDFKDNSFDVVIANQIYEFVKDPQSTFSEINRVLKKGGICFMGARNKLAVIEAQYNLPFLSWLPIRFADIVVRITGKGNKFIGRYKTYSELKKLVSKFKIHDYTIKILRSPEKYGYEEIKRYAVVAKIIPLEYLLPILPNYIWILEKR
jgi:glycosyltransferase involved in cell wall biosynthesis/ubiquinone/menaquinone biosynthesis C-methylase UbiE